MITATCRTPDCPQLDVEVPIDIVLGPDEPVWCGTCSQPTEVVRGE